MGGRHAPTLQLAGRCCFGLRRALCGPARAPLAAHSIQKLAGLPGAFFDQRKGAAALATAFLRPSLHLHGAARARPHQLAGIRRFNSQARREGTVKMWNEDRGFGFITPGEGGEDVFVHRSALQEGATLQPGMAVTYEATWDDKKRKDRATDVSPAPSQEGPAAPGGGGGAAGPPPRAHNLVGAFSQWAIQREAMAPDGSGELLRQRLTVRSDAPKADGSARREDFQIVGDASWDKRYYPAGGDKEETVVIRPGQAPQRADMRKGKGHGRNFAVEGRPGSVFDILFNPSTQMVSCELAFSESDAGQR